jgi:hypothetical protein
MMFRQLLCLQFRLTFGNWSPVKPAVPCPILLHTIAAYVHESVPAAPFSLRMCQRVCKARDISGYIIRWTMASDEAMEIVEPAAEPVEEQNVPAPLFGDLPPPGSTPPIGPVAPPTPEGAQPVYSGYQQALMRMNTPHDAEPPVMKKLNRVAWHWTVGKRACFSVEGDLDEVTVDNLSASEDRATSLELSLPSANDGKVSNAMTLTRLVMKTSIDLETYAEVQSSGYLQLSSELTINIRGHSNRSTSSIAGVVQTEGKGRGKGSQ